MKTLLILCLIDSHDNGNASLKDELFVPYSDMEQLFKAVFGTASTIVPKSDTEIGITEDGNPFIQINFLETMKYPFGNHTGRDLYGKILTFFVSAQKKMEIRKLKFENELTDEEAYAIENGDVINEGIYTPDPLEDEWWHDEFEGILEYGGLLEYMLGNNNNAEEKLNSNAKRLIKLIDEKTFKYIMDLIQLEKERLEQEMLKNNADYKSHIKERKQD
jgi:hypothetical protein